jgi:lathosterol oxidase
MQYDHVQIFYNIATEASTYISIYFVIGTCIELYTGTLKQTLVDVKRRNATMKQIMHSVPMMICGIIFSQYFRNIVEPMTPYYKYYETHDYTIYTFIMNFFEFLFMWETMFYWFHRFMHITKPINIYKIVHKVHHYPEVTPWIAFAASIYEIIGLTLIMFTPKMIFGIPDSTFGFLSLMTVLVSCASHDTKLDYFGHQLHHKEWSGNYCAYLPVWDYICRTKIVKKE